MPLFTPHIHRVPAFSRQQQLPTGPVEINWAHPLARGLVSLYMPALSPVDLCGVSGALVSGSGSTPKYSVNRFGPAADGTNFNRALFAPAAGLQSLISTQGSILWVGDDTLAGSDHSINSFGWTPNQGAVGPWHYVAIGYFFGKFAFLLANSGNSDVDNFQYYASTPCAALICSAAFTVNVGTNTSVVGYANGTQTFNTTSTRTAALSYPAAATIEINGSGARQSGSTTNLGAIWNRALSNDEQLWLNSDPFCMLQPAPGLAVRRGNVIGGGATSVFFSARALAAAQGRFAPLIGAPSVLRGVSAASAKQAPLAVAPVAARATSESSGRLNPGTAATVSFAARSLSVSTGRLSSVAVATAAVRSTARGVGRMAVSLGAAVRLRAVSRSVGQAGLSIAGLAKKLSQLVWFN